MYREAQSLLLKFWTSTQPASSGVTDSVSGECRGYLERRSYVTGYGTSWCWDTTGPNSQVCYCTLNVTECPVWGSICDGRVCVSFVLTRGVYRLYTGCNRRNGPDFGRVFLMLNYNEKPQNTSIQSWTVWEIMAIENCGLPSGPRTIAVSWNSYLLVGLLAELQQAGVLRHHSTFQYDV